uniref:Uncharacterized protein n=1 Tax=Arundo donax TaxID=35708 RepID=A0A0A9BX62_ARUDO
MVVVVELGHLQLVLDFALLLKSQCVHLFLKHLLRDPKMECLHLFLRYQMREPEKECLHLNHQPQHRLRMKPSFLLQVDVIKMQYFHLSSCCNNSAVQQFNSSIVQH